MELALYVVLGIVIGAIIGFLYYRMQKGAIEAGKIVLEQNVNRLSVEIESLKSELSSAHDDLRFAETQQAVARTKLDGLAKDLQEEKQRHEQDHHAQEQLFAQQLKETKEASQRVLDEREAQHKSIFDAQELRHNEALAHMKESFEQTIADLKDNLKVATEDMLKNRQNEFSDLSQKNIKEIVTPLNDTIARMKEAMEAHTKEQSEFSGSLSTHINTIIQQTETARQSAIELTTALKHDSKMQGDYGEVILDEILQSQKFTRGVHYELQYVMKSEDGKVLRDEEGEGLRPDVIFHLDTVRDVIIDSKINLTDFINFANAETPEEREIHLDRHIKSIERQIKLLSKKDYSKYHKKTSGRMDYVIMFIPISAAWWEALRKKPNLWREAMDDHVYIADEQTLFAALRIIKLTWTQIEQVKNQKVIFDLVDQLIDRVGFFMEQYNAIGSALDSAQKAFEKGREKLTPGGQSIITTAGNLLKKGGKDSKKHPVSPYLDVDDIQQLPDPEDVQGETVASHEISDAPSEVQSSTSDAQVASSDAQVAPSDAQVASSDVQDAPSDVQEAASEVLDAVSQESSSAED